jgi:TolA-binding protein
MLLFAACGNGNENATEEVKMTKEVMEAQIDSMEAKLHAKPEIDYATANATVSLYADFAKNFPDDPKTPDYLFKAGEISSSLQNGKQAVNFFNTVYTKYPNYDKAPYCLFLQGFVYESQLNDTAKAKELYRQVIEKYPNDKLAEDAKASIDNMGKPLEELIREFEKKNPEESPKKPAS